MGKLTRKYVENIEECKYIEPGTICGVCGKKLGYFYDGFWSVNSKDKHLVDGVLCKKCHEHFKKIIEDRNNWATKELKSHEKWRKFTSLTTESYTAEDIKWFFEQKEIADQNTLASFGSHASGIFRIKNAFDIAPHPLQVGVVRARKLEGRMVVFGKVDEGVFQKGDMVWIDFNGKRVETTVAEAFLFDPEAFIKHDMYADFNDTISANLRYTRKIKENRLGWLILDVALLDVKAGDVVVKIEGGK